VIARCIPRHTFLWLSVRHHEPGATLAAPHDYIWRQWHPVHMHVGRTPFNEGHVVHVVATICRHCGQPYWETFHWRDEISWRVFDEISEERANEYLMEAFALAQQ
jgi:hypothetical protein